MIVRTIVFHCPKCDGINVVKNGKNSAGSQQFLRKDCGNSAAMYPNETHRVTGRYDVKSPNCNIYKALFPEALRLEGLRLLKYAEDPEVVMQL